MHEHKPISIDGEIICQECGQVLAVEEVIDYYRDPHGKATLWQYAIGGMNRGKREDISVISNVCQKLNLSEAKSIEVLSLYKRFVKCNRDELLALKLALVNIVEKYHIKIGRREIDSIAELNFGKKSISIFEVEIVSKIANRFGASRSIDYAEVLRWI